MNSIIVFSHLRWDFVYQRPQHLLSRLAEHYNIIFFEEPEFHEGQASLEKSQPLPNLTVCRPRTPVTTPGYSDDQMPYLRSMAGELAEQYPGAIVWFYTPMAFPLLDEMHAGLVVYDCMDELSAFKNSSAQLLQREDALLRRADVVFTGGPSLYNAKKHRNDNVHCFPSSVDVNHFRQALDRNIAHPSQQNLPHPRFGFYGVIDERFDIDIVTQMADTQPDWQIVLVGPVVKIDPAALPQRSNIHYMGQQPYKALPHFLAAWDACLMPFAINESTKFISPTKSLEYMAAELPIISTPIKDVVDLHSDVVEIADGAEAFIEACRKMLAQSDKEMQQRVRMMRTKLSRTSWDVTADKIHELLEQAAVATGAKTVQASTGASAGSRAAVAGASRTAGAQR